MIHNIHKSHFYFFCFLLFFSKPLCCMHDNIWADTRCKESGELCCCLGVTTATLGFLSAYALTSCCARTLTGNTLPLIGVKEPDCCCELCACWVGAEYTTYSLSQFIKFFPHYPTHCITYGLLYNCHRVVTQKRQHLQIPPTIKMNIEKERRLHD